MDGTDVISDCSNNKTHDNTTTYAISLSSDALANLLYSDIIK